MFLLRKITGSGAQADCRTNGAYICDECVDICAEIIEEEFEDEEISGKGKEDLEEINLIKPEEMKKFLDEYVIGQDEAKKFFL